LTADYCVVKAVVCVAVNGKEGEEIYGKVLLIQFSSRWYGWVNLHEDVKE
jgi:hypothetical protein